MGIRKRLKGLVKRAVTGSARPPQAAVAPPSQRESLRKNEGRGNLSDGEDVPWYLQYEDADGWDSTNATPDIDDE